MTRDEEGRDLRACLLAGDTTASNDVVTAYLDDLANWLEKRYYQEHPNDCLTAAQDAILAFIKNPMSYDPEKKTLKRYLQMSANGDMKNLLESERRHSQRRVNLELSEPVVEKQLQDKEADPHRVLERPLHKAQLHDALSAVARARTLTVLGRLNGDRKRSVVQFLYESGLVKDRSVFSVKGANLRDANFRETQLPRVDLSGADLREADFSDTFLQEADLSNANLRRANLEDAVLIGANLRDADFGEANLISADLRGSNLNNAKLQRADLTVAKLGNTWIGDPKEPKLAVTNLSEADLTEAILRRADLSGANLSEVKGIVQEQIGESNGTEDTKLPGHLTKPGAWSKYPSVV